MKDNHDPAQNPQHQTSPPPDGFDLDRYRPLIADMALPPAVEDVVLTALRAILLTFADRTPAICPAGRPRC